MTIIKLFPKLHLQMFADGGADGAGDGAASAGNQSVDYSTIQYGRAAEATPSSEETTTAAPAEPAAPPDLDAEFKELSKGKYKDQFGKAVKDAVDKRFKSNQETIDRAKAQAPVFDLLANKYKLDANDAQGILKALQDDDALWEAAASDAMMSVDQYKTMKKVEYENAALHRQMQEREQQEGAQRVYNQWLHDAEAVKLVYPGFDLNAELANEETGSKFAELLGANVGMQQAYEVCHLNEIIPGAMQFSAQKMQEATAKAVAAGQSRPKENGISGSSVGAITRSDPSKLTFRDIDEVIRRVNRGDKVSF